MCGIVGVIAKPKNGFTVRQENVFYDMLYADALRGWDSTGVISIENDNKFHIAKEASEASDFVPAFKQLQMARDVFSRGKALIGHNRKKTMGKLTDENAHPFIVKDCFAMVHNGTLLQHEKLAKTDVDSEALAMVIEEALHSETPHASLEDMIGKVWGAYAIAAYSQLHNAVYLLRNKERPMSLFETDDAWYFGSESMMVSWCLMRNGYSPKNVKYIEVKEDVLFKIELEETTCSSEVVQAKKYVMEAKSSHGKNTATAAIKEPFKLSETSFRRLCKKWIGRRIAVDVQEYVELSYPKTVEEGAQEVLLFGQCEDFPHQHHIYAEIDMSKFSFNNPATDIVACRWLGLVDQLEQMENSDNIVITLTDLKPILKSVISLPDKDNLSNRQRNFQIYINGCSDRELINMTKDTTDMFTWQLKMIYNEQRARMNNDDTMRTLHESTVSIH